MTALDSISFPILLLEDDDLVGLYVIEDGGLHRRPVNQGLPDRNVPLLLDEQHAAEIDLVSDFGIETRNKELLFLLDAILFAGNIYNSVHFSSVPLQSPDRGQSASIFGVSKKTTDFLRAKPADQALRAGLQGAT